MLKIIPKCLFDLSGLQPDFTVKVVGRSFPTYRFLLIIQSDFFRKLLAGGFKEGSLTEYNFGSGNPHIFSLILKTIQGESFDLPDLQTALSYLIYINYLQIKNIDSLQILRDLEVTPGQFMYFIEVLDKLYPEGFSPEIIQIITMKTTPETDLSGLSPELRSAIEKSEDYIFPGVYPILTRKIWQLAQRHKADPETYFYYGDGNVIFRARSLPEALLKLRQYILSETREQPDPTRGNVDYITMHALNERGLDENTVTLDDLEEVLEDRNRFYLGSRNFKDLAFIKVGFFPK